MAPASADCCSDLLESEAILSRVMRVRAVDSVVRQYDPIDRKTRRQVTPCVMIRLDSSPQPPSSIMFLSPQSLDQKPLFPLGLGTLYDFVFYCRSIKLCC